MEPPAKKRPRRNDERVILQFDYDCFYAQVIENKNPLLKSKPVGVKQKNILATCNYNARARGVKKLMLITEAKKACPDLVLVDGEDLTSFRDTSKILFNFLKSHSWNGKAERLGFDEVFLDVTDIIDYNLSCLNKSSLESSFFFLSNKDPELGFTCDLSSVAGPTMGDVPTKQQMEDLTYLRLLLGSHFAMYLRTKLEKDFGYTSTCGIATNKVLSKLAGSKNKPSNQTTLLSLSEDAIAAFMDQHKLRQVPGLGFKMVQRIESHITQQQKQDMDITQFDSVLHVGEVKNHADINAAFLEKLLAGPGAEKGCGARVWGLLHGVDTSEVKETGDVPSQISIEDTYKGLETLPRITEELFKLSCSLIRRMRIDLVHEEDDTEGLTKKWRARPKTLRLSVRWWSIHGARNGSDFSRVSKSSPLPKFVFDIEDDMEEQAQRLVSEALLPLIRKLQAEQDRRWNLQLINICVANMEATAADDKHGIGRDISVMFKRQDEVLRPWKITDSPPGDKRPEVVPVQPAELELEEEFEWEDAVGDSCHLCGNSIPEFAKEAHMRFHQMATDTPV